MPLPPMKCDLCFNTQFTSNPRCYNLKTKLLGFNPSESKLLDFTKCYKRNPVDTMLSFYYDLGILCLYFNSHQKEAKTVFLKNFTTTSQTGML